MSNTIEDTRGVMFSVGDEIMMNSEGQRRSTDNYFSMNTTYEITNLGVQEGRFTRFSCLDNRGRGNGWCLEFFDHAGGPW